MTRVIMLVLLLVSLEGKAQQNCNLSISGRVIDEHDGQALSFAEVSIPALALGTVVDSAGFYQLTNLCPGRYQIQVTHVGCEPVSRWVMLEDNLINQDFYLEHHEELLDEIVLVDQHIRRDPKPAKTLDQAELSRVQQLGLEVISEEVAGYQNLTSGNNIIKPVIHGMYGNRVTTMVNGIPLEDQQWGREHALTTDPAMAGSASVVSGAASIEYGPGALGGVLILAPAPLPSDSVLSGSVNLNAQSNGRGGTTNLKLEQGLGKGISWRAQAGATRLGDVNAPRYNLSNTGLAALNYSLEAGITRKKWQSRIFYQGAFREIGVLRASSVGNITDLEDAISRTEPLYQEAFTYSIAPPRQEVAHHSIGGEWRFRYSNRLMLQASYGFQKNRRREYDFRRVVSDETPANDLSLTTHTADLKIQHGRSRNHQSKYGLSALIQENSNIPGTGIRPILPNYNRYRFGFYSIQDWEISRWVIKAGFRYDYEYTLAQKYDRNQVLLKPEFSYHIISANLGTTYRINERAQFSSDLSLASRPPHVIELLSEGLHHGAASIELGDSSLVPEYAFNWSNSLRFIPGQDTRLEITAFFNPVKNYIFQIADSVPRLTIRGAFPVWRYVQSDVLLAGADLSFETTVRRHWRYALNASFVRGYDTGNDQDLILMPPFNLHHGITWLIGENISLGIRHEWTARQNHYPEDLDLSPPPAAFNLLHVEAGWKHRTLPLEININVRNLTNTSYRMYLDRFRYYADRPGINFVVNVKYQF